MAFDTYAEFQAAPASDKVTLAVMEARRRLLGWVLHSGSVYKLEGFDCQKVVAVEDSGTAYAAGSSASLSASQFYHDRQAGVLYVRATGSVNPNSRFLVLTENLYFSTQGLSAPSDHGTWAGYEVYWRDGLQETSEFGVELDTENQMGETVEGTGSISLKNDQEYWRAIFEKKSFNQGSCYLYSWSRELPISQAKILYRGKVQGKSYSESRITFRLVDRLAELRAPVLSDADRMSEVAGARVSPRIGNTFQRRIYGEPKGVVITSTDQVLEDTGYPLAGTVAISSGLQTLTGSGTAFLTDLSPGDELLIEDEAEKVTVESIQSNTSATLSEVVASTRAGQTYAVKPSNPKRYINRAFKIAGHAIREPVTEVVSALNTSQITVLDATDFEADCDMVVGTTITSARRVLPGEKIRLDTNLELPPAAGTEVKRLAVTNVRLNERLLQYLRDYTYDAAEGTLTLDELAEFNVAPVRVLAGEVIFTSASRTVTGTDTAFTTQLKPGDWIRSRLQSVWYEVLQVVSDTELNLRIVSAYTATDDCLYKNPHVYDSRLDTLSADVLGATEDGTPEGVWIKTAPQAVKHLLVAAGFTADIEDATFTQGQGIAYQRIGLVVPDSAHDTRAPTYRDTIGLLNKSVFGSLVQTPDFTYQYNTLRPSRVLADALRLDEADALEWSITAQLEKIVKTVRVEFVKREFDWKSGASSTQFYSYDNRIANYIAKATKEFVHSCVLVKESEAQVLAQRLAFLFSTAYSTLSIETKMQASRKKVGDVIDFSHEKLYEPEASTTRRKIGTVRESKRSGTGAKLQVEDLANAFAQCGTITPAGVDSWGASSENDRLYHGFITDDFGMQGNDPDTFGVNRIW